MPSRRSKPKPAAAQNTCRICGHRPGYQGTDFCMRCIVATRERLRCPDCDCTVVMMLAEGVEKLYANLTSVSGLSG